MRILTIASASCLLLLATAAPGAACSGPSLHTAESATVELAAAKKKTPKNKGNDRIYVIGELTAVSVPSPTPSP